jgi:hypothetical protein
MRGRIVLPNRFPHTGGQAERNACGAPHSFRKSTPPGQRPQLQLFTGHNHYFLTAEDAESAEALVSPWA